MRGRYTFLALALVAQPGGAAEIDVRVAEGLVDLSATTAPVADVLDHLAAETGMEVVYEGPAPRQLVSVSLAEQTPVEVVISVLEGLGLNYVIESDATGTGVQTLIMAGSAPLAGPLPADPRSASSRPRPFRPPVAYGPSFPAGTPGAVRVPGRAGFPGATPNPAASAVPGVTSPGVGSPGFPGGAAPSYPVSSFTPTPLGTRPALPASPQPGARPTPAPGRATKAP